MEPSSAVRANRPRVLIIFPGALGDLICFTPTIGALRRRHPDASLELMAQERLARFALSRIGVDRAHSIDRREVSLLFVDPGRVAADAYEFFAHFDRVYSFFASDDPGFRASLCSIVGSTASFHPFRAEGSGHVAVCYLRSIGESCDSPEARLELPSGDLDAARKRLGACGLAPPKFVALVPGSGSPKKNWPAEGYKELARRLRSRRPVAIVLGPAEDVIAGLFSSREVPVLNHLDLGELAGILASASFFLGNDSGVSHLAAAVGTSGVAIFGPTDPERWRPLGDVEVIRGLPISTVTVDEVLSAIESKMRRTATERGSVRAVGHRQRRL